MKLSAKRQFLASATLFCLAASIAWSCQIPVFRYALELWQSANYRLVILHHGPIDETVQADLLELQNRLSQNNSNTNLELEVIDVDRIPVGARNKLPGIDTMHGNQSLALISPYSETPVFTAPLDRAALSKITTSPARKLWAKKIIAGASVVWIVIPGDDPTETQRTIGTLEAGLGKAEQEIEIPEGVIKFKDAPKDDPNFDMENVLRSQIPLKIHFPIMQVDPDDPAEACFVKMLTSELPDSESGKTIVVPLFGRGRMLPPIPADKVTEETILAGCRYLCGACSCQVKEQNPGRDIVVQQEWDQYLQTGRIAVDLDLPPLQGAGEFTEKDTAKRIEPQGINSSTLQRNLIGTGIAVALLLAIGSFIVKRN